MINIKMPWNCICGDKWQMFEWSERVLRGPVCTKCGKIVSIRQVMRRNKDVKLQKRSCVQ